MNLADYAWTAVAPDGTRKGYNRKTKALLTGHPVRRSTREDYGHYRLVQLRLQIEGLIVRRIGKYAVTLGQLPTETILQTLLPAVEDAVRLAQRAVGKIQKETTCHL